MIDGIKLELVQPGLKFYMVKIQFLNNYHNTESHRLLRFGVGLFDGRFGVGFGVAFPIYPESESESGVA